MLHYNIWNWIKEQLNLKYFGWEPNSNVYVLNLFVGNYNFLVVRSFWFKIKFVFWEICTVDLNLCMIIWTKWKIHS